MDRLFIHREEDELLLGTTTITLSYNGLTNIALNYFIWKVNGGLLLLFFINFHALKNQQKGFFNTRLNDSFFSKTIMKRKIDNKGTNIYTLIIFTLYIFLFYS